MTPSATALSAPTFGEALGVWVKIGLLSFGGPAGQIALMHRILVEEKGWVEEEQFLHALNYCMLLPGPEAQQLATYVGWLLHGARGGLAAGLLFIIPGAVVILGLSAIYAAFSAVPLLAAVFVGIKAAVLVIVIEAVGRIGKRVLKNTAMRCIAALAFLGIFVGHLPFPLIVLGAGLIGLAGARFASERFAVLRGHGEAVPARSSPAAVRSGLTTLGIGVGGVLLWAAPVAAAAALLGTAHVLVTQGVFFSKLAVVTFGGAYAVLAYMAQQAVEAFGWLTPGEMMDGLGLAESTPGPLILVVQFVGFLGAYRNAAPFDPVWAALLGSAMTLWVTFVPCFLWIFIGAPYVERIRYNGYLSAALSAITAAVVGVILNLAVWFGAHVLFGEVRTASIGGLRVLAPDFSSLDPIALGLAIVAGIALLRYHLGVVWTIAGCAGLGALLSLL